MKTIEEIIKNYENYETYIEDRFGRRLCQFLTREQMVKIGFELGGNVDHIPKE